MADFSKIAGLISKRHKKRLSDEEAKKLQEERDEKGSQVKETQNERFRRDADEMNKAQKKWNESRRLKKAYKKLKERMK